MKAYKCSFHSHTSEFAHLIFTHPDKEKYFENLLDRLSKVKGDLVLGVGNSNDSPRYQRLLKIAEGLKNKYEMNLKYKDQFFSIKNSKKEIYFVKTDEIGTKKGHILIIGFKGKIGTTNLKDVVKKARKQNCIIISNHPLHEFGAAHFLIKKIFGSDLSKMSITKKDLRKNKKSFDALELNSYFPEDWNKIKRFAKKNNLKIVSDSDAHSINEIFVAWYEARLDFSSPKKFKKSLNKSFKKNLKLHARKHGYLAKYKHALQIFIEVYGKRTGLIKN